MPAARILFHPLAAREYCAARSWYADRSLGAAERFLVSVDRAVDRVAADYEALPRLVGPYRWARVGRFPYVLIVRARSEKIIVVVAVAHAKRRPGYWRKRQ